MVFQNDILAGASGTTVSYTIDQSIRFNDNDSAYLNDTQPTVDGSSFTFSFWIKRGNLGTEQWIINGSPTGSLGYPDYIRWESTDKIRYRIFSKGKDATTTAVFRDVGAWYHIVANYNGSTGATKLWVNNQQHVDITGGSSGSTYYNNTGQILDIGRAGNGVAYTDGYLAEIVKLDNIVADPTSFGEYNDDGVWVPKDVSGLTFGSGGFYLKGQDSADLGNDSSGNGNDFTSGGLTSADQVSDSPTLNFPVISPIDRQSGASAPLSDGNLKFTNNNTATSVDARATFALPKGQGKWYFEMEADILGQSGINREFIGIVSTEWRIDSGTGGNAFWISADGFSFSTAGSKGNNGSLTSYGSAWSAGNIIGCAVDLDNNKIWWSINNTWQNSGDPAAGTNAAFTSLSSDVTYAPAFAVDYGTGVSQIIANFGQTGGLTYTPPTGFSQIDSSTLPTPAIKDGSAYFQPTLYTGTGSTLEVNQTGNSTFQPDFVWIKQRNKTDNHIAADIVNGSYNGYHHYVNNQNSAVQMTTGVTSFDADGFTLGTWNNLNQSSITAVAWQWLASNSTSSNATGNITSTVSANTTSGFSVVGYTGNGSGAQTIGHGLGTTPSTLVIFPVSNGDHKLISNWETGVTAFTEKLKLNDTEAASSSTNQITAGSSTTFTVGSDVNVNGSGRTYVAFCWAEVEGFSKIATYEGNGSTDGPFVWCGFRPAFVMIKNASSATNWKIFDSAREPDNLVGAYLEPNTTAAEANLGGGNTTDLDFLSNGFKLRGGASTINNTGSSHIFMAFAENPFGGNGVAPVPAR